MVLGLFSKKNSFLMLELHSVPSQCQVKKQMELHIQYWSPVHNEVWIRYYISEFFGHAEGATVGSAFMSAFRSDSVPLTQLLTLGSDGPNVNKTIWREMEQKIWEVYQKSVSLLLTFNFATYQIRTSRVSKN